MAEDFEDLIYGSKDAGNADDFESLIYGQAAQEQRQQQMTHGETEAQMRSRVLGESVGQIGGLGAPGLNDTAARAAMGWGDNPAERVAAFKKRYPNGDITYAPSPSGAYVELYRESPEDDWKEVDARFLDKFEPLKDLADLSGTAPELAGEAASLAATRGAPTLYRVGAQALGAAAGELAQQAQQSIAGTQQETLPQITNRAGLVGGLSALGGGASEGVLKGLNILRGTGVGVHPEKAAIQKMAGERGWPPLFGGQISDNPVVERVHRQASTLSSKLQNEVRRQEDVVRDELLAVADAQKAGFLANNLEQAYQAEKKDILMPGTPRRSLSMKRAGESLQSGMQRFDNAARARVNKAYNDARAIEEPVFDATELIQWAKGELAPDPFPKANGEIGYKQKPMPEAVRKGLKTLSEMDPSLPSMTLDDGTQVSGFKVAEALRREFFDYKNPKPGDPFEKTVHGSANDAFNKLTDVLYNPENVNPEFAKAWGKARSAAQERFAVLEADWARKVLRASGGSTESYTQVANALAKPEMVEQITFLRKNLSKQDYGKFKDAVIGKFMEDPASLTKTVANFDKQTAKALLNEGDWTLLSRIGGEFDKLNSTRIQEVLAKEKQYGAIIKDLVLKNDDIALDRLRLMAHKHSPLGESMRAAMVNDIVESSTEEVAGRTRIMPKKLHETIRKYQATGARKFLSDEEWQVLNDARKYLEVVDVAEADAGASLQAAEAVSQLKTLNPKGASKVLHAYTTGRFLLSPVGRRFLSGKGAEPWDFKTLSLYLNALTQTNKHLLSSSEIPDDLKPQVAAQ